MSLDRHKFVLPYPSEEGVSRATVEAVLMSRAQLPFVSLINPGFSFEGGAGLTRLRDAVAVYQAVRPWGLGCRDGGVRLVRAIAGADDELRALLDPVFAYMADRRVLTPGDAGRGR